MRTKYCVLFLLLAALCPVAYGKSHSSGSKPVHVDGYYRKDGTYVRPHARSLPGYGEEHHTATSPAPASTYHPQHESHSYQSGYMADGFQRIHPGIPIVDIWGVEQRS